MKQLIVATVVTLLLPRATLGQAPPSAAPPPPSLRYRVLVAEDARAATREEASPILEALGSPDSSLVRLAVRALGRLENPLFLPESCARSATRTRPSVRKPPTRWPS